MKRLHFIYILLISIFFIGCNNSTTEKISQDDLYKIRNKLLKLQKTFVTPMLDYEIRFDEQKGLQVVMTDSSRIVHPEVTKYLFNYLFITIGMENNNLLKNQNITFFRNQIQFEKLSYSIVYDQEKQRKILEIFTKHPRAIDSMKFFFDRLDDYQISYCDGVFEILQEDLKWFSFEDSFMHLLYLVLDDCKQKETTENFGPMVEIFSDKEGDKYDHNKIRIYDALKAIWKRCGRDTADIYGLTRKLNDKKTMGNLKR